MWSGRCLWREPRYKYGFHDQQTVLTQQMGAIFKYGGSILSGEGIEFTKGHDDAVKFFVASVVADILKNILRLWSTVRALSPSVLYGGGRKVRADAVMFPFSQGLRVQTRAATHIQYPEGWDK